jgi:tRNA pseudouridine55 synthase
MHGVLVLNKPVGPSSHDVVSVARRALGVRRIGHTGTLDPRASGVLPLVIGQATRLAQYLTSSAKTYEATIRFGVTSDTYDAAGAVTHISAVAPAREAVETALDAFRGSFTQVPPAFSAKIVDGERAYVRARAGQEVVTKGVLVHVHRLELLAYDPPLARVLVHSSAGFYVRSLAHDLGQALGTGAILDALVRTEAGGFTLEDALPFEMLATAARADLQALIRPMSSLLADVPAVRLTAEGAEWVRHGREIGPRQLSSAIPPAAPLLRLLLGDGTLLGLAESAKTPGFLHPTLVFRYN